MQDNTVDESCGRVLPEGVFASSVPCFDHHLRDGRNIGEFLKGLKVDLCERIPLCRRAVLTERLKFHDLLPKVLLAPSCGKVPKFRFGIEKEYAVLPADSCRDHVADTLAASRRCNE